MAEYISRKAVVLGWLGIILGLLVFAFGAGLVMQLVYSLIRFEPRKLKHKDDITLSKVLLRRK